MERLTVKTENGYEINLDMIDKDIEDCRTKLGKCEDLEEEIGCPVKVIYKALTDGVYTEVDTYGKDAGNGLRYFKEIYISINGIELLHNSMFKGIESIGIRQLKDYKKTWWLKPDKSE